jgi:hypothetical protein
MKRKIITLCLFVVLTSMAPLISYAQIEEDVASFVLTNEGNDRMIDRLEAAGCNNLYDALLYLRNDLASATGAPSHLTSQMDALITALNAHPGGEVFTAPLHDFTGANNPVGINADGTFIRADFSVYDYDGHTGYTRFTIDGAATAIGSELYSNSSGYDIYIGSSEGVNYKAFALAWSETPASIPTLNEWGLMIT